MAYTKFDPNGRQQEESSLIQKKQQSRVLICFQLFIIFAVVRFVMILMRVGIPFIPLRVPILDDLLIKLVLMLR